ncbi:MAG: adenosine deaminase [Planctomycetes bacterium]|nr:adenosine deaminase [Planctomycetota bacterium]
MDFKKLPKIDLHRHLEGAVKMNTLMDISKEFRIPLPTDNHQKLAQYYKITQRDPSSFLNYLGKFNFIRNFWVSREVIERAAYEAVADAAQDGIKYLEIRFSPIPFARRENFQYEKVAEWVIGASRRAAKSFGVQLSFIVTVVRHFDFKLQEPVLELAIGSAGELFSGIDLAGNEFVGDASEFGGSFNRAKKKGMGLTIHAGEVRGGSVNIRQAIEEFNCDRIGHGIFVLEDDEVVKLASKRNVTFEVCPTSNRHTGGWSGTEPHPVREMLRRGIKVTLNTDNPQISGTSLSNEFETSIKNSSIKESDIKTLLHNSCEAVFLPSERKKYIEGLVSL